MKAIWGTRDPSIGIFKEASVGIVQTKRSSIKIPLEEALNVVVLLVLGGEACTFVLFELVVFRQSPDLNFLEKPDLEQRYEEKSDGESQQNMSTTHTGRS